MGIRWLYPVRRNRGFTLIEAALAIVIIGVGITASMALFSTCTRQNLAANQLSTAILLANNIHERLAKLPFTTNNTTFGPQTGQTLATFTDVDDFDGASITPPIDSNGNATTLTAYAQQITVEPVDSLNLAGAELTLPSSAPAGGYTYGAVRITVRILYSSAGRTTEVYRVSWIRPRS